MKVLLFGATGMVGQGVLRECLQSNEVETLLAVGRTSLGRQHDKLREIVHQDLFDLSAIESQLAGFDACFFCLGVSSAGMKERDYYHLTFDLTLAVAQTLVRLNKTMTFIYVSGMGTDSSEHGRVMWARVKGKTENALLKLPLKAAYMFRPAYIQPMHGIQAKTKIYRWFYAVLAPLFPLWNLLFSRYVTTTEQVGRAMIQVALHGASKPFLENSDIKSFR